MTCRYSLYVSIEKNASGLRLPVILEVNSKSLTTVKSVILSAT